MYEFKRSALALVGVLILVGIAIISKPHTSRGASGTGSNAPTSQTQNVNVVNTPAVNAQQTGAWNVGINGTPSISVANFPATSNVAIDGSANTVKVDTTNPIPVRDVDNPARQPFRTSVFVSLADGSTLAGTNPGLTPPAGKVLVIEQISINGNAPSGQKFACVLDVTDNFAQVLLDQAIPLTLQGTFGPVDTFQGNLPTRMYLQPSDNIAFNVFRTSGTGTAGVRVSFSGHFVDAQ